MDKYADLLAKIEQFEALAKGDYASNYTVHGPYFNGPKKRQIVIVIDRKGKRRTVSYPKWLMECHQGKPLEKGMTVDHLDFNFNNNDINNLRVVDRSTHSADDTRRVKLIKLKCAECGKDFDRSPRLLRDKTKKGKVSAFCSRECAGKYSRKVQLGQIDKLPVQPYIESEYYRRKNVKAFVDYLIVKYALPQETFIAAQKRLLAGLKDIGWAVEGSKAISPDGAEITIHTRLRFPVELHAGSAWDGHQRYERLLPVAVDDIRDTSLEQLISAINDLRHQELRSRLAT